MGIKLFEHNRSAYEAAVAMLAETGKAAIIHPTGTGKSFIGFKLCENIPDKTILWLSPSEYIFKTQLENLAAVSDGWQPENIVFFTYAKLMLFTDEEIAELHADIIVFDEYHRAGAQCWQIGVERLLKAYPEVPILGLSATNIRYLDNQRDMAEELFEGNVASRMTLGEAIVRGILNPPKYVLSIYSYQKDLEKYEKRVNSAKSKAVRDEAIAYLEELRRALKNADGIDEIFDKHMTDRHGKYIVFTPNYDSMHEYIDLADDWFGKIDKHMHIYSVYSDDTSSSKAFRDFKVDNSDHLRLLYCIDALNEGVHVEDVSGVILLRPTISPIIYKQQIGRALSASKLREPVIFDIVNNIENLYCIDSIKEEMRNAIFYYRSKGGEGLVINDSFEVIDKLVECKELFEQLEGILTASWDIMYSIAERYFQENGNLDPPKRWISEEGYSLGSWLTVQRRVRSGKINGILTDEQIEKLDRLGMRWDSMKDIAWNKYYSAALAYFQEYGSLEMNARYVTDDGVKLGAWLAQLRTSRKIGMNSSYLTSEHIAQLDELGMIWDIYDFVFERNYNAAVEYYRIHGDLESRYDYVTPSGIRLGAWLNNLRQQYKRRGRAILSYEQFKMLDALGMRWVSKYDQQWEDFCRVLTTYIKQTGSTDVPATCKQDGISIGRWLRKQKDLFMNGKLRRDRAEKLRLLGIKLTIEDPWEVKYQLAKVYSEAHGGSLNVPADTVADGVWLNKWLNEQKLIGEGKRKKKLTNEQRQKLESIGMVFGKTSSDRSWEAHYLFVKSYIEQTGDLDIPKEMTDSESVNIRLWLDRQLLRAKKGQLEKEKAEKLHDLGFKFEPVDSFDLGFSHAKEYFEQYGNLLVKNGYKSADGYNLSTWIKNIRSKKERLSDEQIKILDGIGMIWNTFDHLWNEMFNEAKKYACHDQPLKIPKHQLASNGRDLYDWYVRQRRQFLAGKLSDDKVDKLLSIGAELQPCYTKRQENSKSINNNRKMRTQAVNSYINRTE